MSNVVHVSDFTARRGIQQGRFRQCCDRCSAAHNDYGTFWARCRECDEICCPDCAQPGTESDEEVEDSTGVVRGTRPTAVCRRCAEEQQEEEAAQTCDTCHERKPYICLATTEDAGGGLADVRVCKTCAPGKWRRFLESQEDDCG